MAKMEVVKRVKNAVLYKDGMIRIDNVRGSYVHLDKPYKGKAKRDDGTEATPKFSIVGIMPKDSHVEAKDLILDAIKQLLADNKNAKVPKDKRFIRDGDDAEKDEYENAWTVSASEINKPRCRDRQGELVSEPDEIREMFKSGYWFNILIRPWFQDNDYGKRVNAGIVGVQFVKKDKTFGNAEIDDSDAWDTVDAEDDDDGFGDDGDDDGL
jgi:hypothetical protein